MSLDGLRKRIDALLVAIERAQAAQTALPEWQQWAIASSLIGEGLSKKLALIGVDTTTGIHQVSIPEDYHEQCKRIDSELEQEQTPEERELLARYRYKFAGQLAGAKEQLLQRLERMSEDEAA